MGPGNSSVPSRPKFSWDIRSTPWTDGRRNQEGFARAVKLWEQFHNKLPPNNSNKIPADLRGICLKSQLFGRALDLTKGIADDLIGSEEGVTAIVAAVYKRDALSVVNEVYTDFTDLLALRRGSNESFRNYEARFAAQVAKMQAHGESVALHESLLAMMLLSGSSVDDLQRIPILSAAGGRQTVNADQSSDAIVAEINYEAVASVLRQCDAKSSPPPGSSSATISANTARYSNSQYRRGGRNNGQHTGLSRSGRPRMTPDELRAYKLRCVCNACKMREHWASDHNDDGSIKNGLPSLPPNTVAAANNAAANNANAQQPVQQPQGNNIISFTALLSASTAGATTPRQPPGPLVDDGAPFSAIGLTELRLLAGLAPTSSISLDPKPASLSSYDWWQYGQGQHASNRRRILGSVNITAVSDAGNLTRISHLVVEGSSQWVIGRNVTRAGDILHYGGSRVLFPPINGFRDSFSMIDDGLHSYISFSRFPAFALSRSSATLACCSAAASHRTTTRPWSEVQRVIDKVHRHTCGHACFADMRTLLQRNDYWSNDAQKYLSEVIERCQHCLAASVPPPSRKVALGTLNRSFNDVVMVDHFFLDQLRVFHDMDSLSRFSATFVVPDMTPNAATLAFETVWVSQFWPPLAVQGDQAFVAEEFQAYLQAHGISFRPVPSRRHHKNTLEPKHGIIRSIYLRLVSAAPNARREMLALHAVRISNDLYGSDTLSAFELAKGFTKPISADSSRTPIPQDLLDARDVLLAKRKLNLILRSKVTTNPP